ncbi:hypothetical protein [Ruthenibacterium lactatiformans]|jgi:hypothetical protein|uniref:hypothetical protein n=1 Tax=Ruthenibacterium lactatiformans TaxID=1550024 RepID=UPI0019679BA6|nr:hypothetical protein [Ruthenibacterium lactatiformans]MBN3007472.1 hypothetical protein [Ruthenibacterium lactatiformans]
MAASKKKKTEKVVKQSYSPNGRTVRQTENPERYYNLHPSWNFNTCDIGGSWDFAKESVGESLWDEILPRLKAWESQTWNEILIVAKDHNHSIDVNALNPCAQTRLTEKFIEWDSIVSLRLTNTHRLYGYIIGSVFNVLWYDTKHGDNSECVCRCRKKHT